MIEQILIYRSELLAYSETFIAEQARAALRYSPVFAGSRRVSNSLTLPGPSFVVDESGSIDDRARRLLFCQTGYAPYLIRQLRARRPRLLHAHFALDAAEALPLARSLAIPMVVTLHGYDVMVDDDAHRVTPRGRIYLARRKDLMQFARSFVCVSEAIRHKAIERGFPADKLHVLPIGIDVSRFKPAERLPEEPSVLFVGRLVEKKGCSHLLQAMGLVQQSLPSARLVVVGDGPERVRLEAEAPSLGLDVTFTGVQSAEQVRGWMASSRMLAVPSITARDGDAEGLPTVLYEALAMGLPVACFRSSGIPELVRDGVEGMLAEERDTATLAAHLLRLCEDDELAARLGRAGRRRVEESFDLQAQTLSLESLYDNVLAGVAYSPRPALIPDLQPLQPGHIAAMAAEADDTSAKAQIQAPSQHGARASVPDQVEGAACPIAVAINDGAPAVPAGQRLRSQAAWMISGNGVAVLFQAIYFLLIGRMLGSREYGALVGVVALVNVLAQFSSLGMEMVLLRNISRDRSLFAASWGRALVVSGIGCAVLLVVALLYGQAFLAPGLRLLVPWIAVSDGLFGKPSLPAERCRALITPPGARGSRP